MRRRAVPTGGCESVRFKERRGREIFGEFGIINASKCIFYIVPQLYLIVYAVSEIFWKKFAPCQALSSIVPFSNFFA